MMHTTWWPWACAAALYALFRLWYDNWRGKLTPAEIETFMHRAATQREARGGEDVNDPAVIRAFLEADDGREFVMLNLVRIAPGLPIRRGGHPAIVARKVGGYVDAWGVAPDPGWDIVGFMRYRSRRDLMILATDSRFKDIHQFKLAGISGTFSFPTQPWLNLFVGPRLWLGLLLALAAALF
jgi:hypothetical protein